MWFIWVTLFNVSVNRFRSSDDLLYMISMLGHHGRRRYNTSKGKVVEKVKGSPYSITVYRVPKLIPVLGSQPAGDVSHKPGGRLPYFLPGLQLPPLPLRGLIPILLLFYLLRQMGAFSALRL